MISSVTNKKAIFVNTENVVDIDGLMAMLEQYKSTFDVFISDHSNLDISSLCTGNNASFGDFDYVVLINPCAKDINEHTRTYNSRQLYYMFGLLENPDMINKTISLLEADKFMGFATPTIDYLKSLNWEHYEEWASYYKSAEKWITKNHIAISLNNDRPPISPIGGCCVIKTVAIKNMDKLHFNIFNSEFIGYALALVCQSNGFLPHYITTKHRLINNNLGYETYTSCQPNILNVKKEYYALLAQYNCETEKSWNQQVASLQQEISALREANNALQKGFLHTFSRKLKTMLRIIRNSFRH